MSLIRWWSWTEWGWAVWFLVSGYGALPAAGQCEWQLIYDGIPQPHSQWANVAYEW